MWTPKYFVRTLDFTPPVEGVIVPNDDGTFDIYLSSRLIPQWREECLAHELRPISRDHFYSERPVEDLERVADGLPPEGPFGGSAGTGSGGCAGARGGQKNEPRGTADFINIFALPDFSIVPIFASIAERTGKK